MAGRDAHSSTLISRHILIDPANTPALTFVHRPKGQSPWVTIVHGYKHSRLAVAGQLSVRFQVEMADPLR